MTDTTIRRKITVRDVWGKIDRPKEGDLPVEIMHVIGVAEGTRYGEDKFNAGQQFVALTGRFEAVNVKTGEVTIGPQCFIPEPMQSLIASELANTDTEGVKFAVSISYKYSNTPIGYEYIVKPLVEFSGVDPLADIRKMLPKGAPQLQLVKATDGAVENNVEKAPVDRAEPKRGRKG